MIGVVFLATVAVLIVRRKILAADKAATSGSMMDDFRRLHAGGRLSDAEFQALRSRMAARMKGETTPAPRPPSAPERAVRPARAPEPPAPPGRRPPPPA